MKYRVYYTVKTSDWIELDDLQSVEPGHLPDGMEDQVRHEAEFLFGEFDQLEIDNWEKV